MDEVKKNNFILINNLSGGGAERQVSNISQLKEIEKIILLEPIISYDIPKEKLVFLSNHKNNFIQKTILLFTISSKLKKIGVNKNSNLICFLQLSYILGLIAKFTLKCKFTICIRTSPFGFYKQYKGAKIPFFIYKYLLKNANTIICNSKTSELQLKNKLNLKQAITISNGYNIESLLKQANEPLGELDLLFEKNKVLITVGRLLHDKGQWHLIRIFNNLLLKEKNIKLVILGEGPMLKDFIKLCEDFQLSVYNYLDAEIKLKNEYDIYFLGFQKNPYKYVSKSYLFLLSSLYEGLPNAPLESLILGTPCVMSDCNSGPREILLPNSDLLSSTNISLKTNFGILVPIFDGQLVLSIAPLNKVEQIWCDSIFELLKNESEHILLKQNCIKIHSKYCNFTVLNQWSKHLSLF